MTNVMLNTQLYQKIHAEQEKYKAYLLSLPPTKILDHAGEYIFRENILMALESSDLDNARPRPYRSPPPRLPMSTRNGRDGNTVDNTKKYGTQLKPVPVMWCGLILLRLRDQKGRR